MKKTVILGASPKPERYAAKALRRLQDHGHQVVAVGARAAELDGVPIQAGPVETDEVDTVTLYLNPSRQKPYYDYIMQLSPKRLIFNPGTENPELKKLAEEAGIETIEACTLVLLNTEQY